MAKIKISIVGNTKNPTDGIDVVIQRVKSDLESLGKTPIKIGIQASGLDAVAAKIREIADAEVKAAEAAAKKANAEARKINAETKAIQVSAKLAKAQKDQAQTAGLAAKEEKNAASAMSLTVRNAGSLEVQIRSLTAAYNELAKAASSASSSGHAAIGGKTQQNVGGGSSPNLLGGWYTVDYYTVEDTVSGIDDVTQSATNATSAFNTLGEGAQSAWTQLSRGTPIADALGDSIGNIIVKITTWQVVNGIVAGIKRAFTDALETMKAVDAELTNIQKVSNLSTAEIKRIGDSAYDAASKFGIAAEDYLASVYAFQKAGLGSSSEDMAELATKTMLVGDTTADVANKFLIAVNAAWELNGSMSELSKIVDQTDFVNNNYATDLEKLADAMPIVASTAANMNMSFEETLALLGTINSKTQETGRKTATAVRSFLIAISGQVGEFVDDVGETYEVTTENVEALTDALKIYGNEAVKTAIRTGEIINPMEALNSLAEAYRDNLLTDSELQEILINVAGKMRYNQLVTIVRDLASETSTYRDILSQLGTAAGTADAEVSAMLSSWDAKVQILTNNFTKFISHVVDSESIKLGIDILNGFVTVLDSGAGKVAALTAEFLMLGKVIAGIAGSNLFNFILVEITQVTTGIVSMEIVLADLWALLSTNPVFWAAAAAAAVYGLAQAYDALNVTFEEHVEKMNEAIQEYKDAESEINSLSSKIEENNKLIAESNELGANDAYQKRLEAENERLQQRLEIEKERRRLALETSANEAVGVLSQRFWMGMGGSGQLFSLEQYLAAAQTLAYSDNRETAAAYQKKLDETIDSVLAARDALLLYQEAGGSLTYEQQKYLDLADSLIAAYVSKISSTTAATKATENEAKAIGEAAENTDELSDRLERLLGIYQDIKEKAEPLTAALEEINEQGYLTTETFQKLLEQYPELAAQARITADGWELSAEALQDQLDALVANYKTVYNNAENAAQNILDSESAKQAGFNKTTQSIYDQIQALGSLYGVKMEEARQKVYAAVGDNGAIGRAAAARDPEVAMWERLYYETAKAGIDLKSTEESYIAALALKDVKTSSSSKSGSSSSSTKDAELERLKSIVSLRESELTLLKAQNAGDDEKIAKIKEIQTALHDEAEYMRSIGADQAEINALSSKWWNLQKDIDDILASTAKTLREDIASAMGDIADALYNQKDSILDPLKEELETLKDEHQAVKDRADEEERLLEVEKARIALENAQKERTVRQYNAAAGQWEWVANAKTVETAQQKYAEAQAKLAEFYTEQEYKTAVDALEQQIDYTESAFKDFKDAWSEATKAVKDGSKTFEEAYSYIGDEMRRIYDKYGVDLSSTLDEVSLILKALNGEYNGISTETARLLALSKMQANSVAWFITEDEEQRAKLHSENVQLGNELGLTYTSATGTWNTSGGSAAYTVSSSGTGESSNSSFRPSSGVGSNQYIYLTNLAANGTAGQQAWAKDQLAKGLYDRGGILRGMGGIKATAEDEMVIPPDATRRILNAERTGDFRAFLSHLGIITSAANEYAAAERGEARNAIGSQHNGDVYEMNGVTISEGQARSMTVFDLAQMGRTLALHKGV